MAQPIVFSVGLFALSGAVTNWLAVHMLFEKVPGLYGSGVIPARFEEFKLAIRHLMMEQFFTEENIDSQLEQLMKDFINDENAQLVELHGQLYQLSLAPIKSGDRLIGWIGFGYLIDTALAQELATLTDVNIAFAIESESGYQIAASSSEEAYPMDSNVFTGIVKKTENNNDFSDSDYVLTNAVLALDTAPASGEKIACHITTASVHDGTSALNQQFTATSGQTAFTLSQDPKS